MMVVSWIKYQIIIWDFVTTSLSSWAKTEKNIFSTSASSSSPKISTSFHTWQLWESSHGSNWNTCTCHAISDWWSVTRRTRTKHKYLALILKSDTAKDPPWLSTEKTLRPQISSQTPSPIFWKKKLWLFLRRHLASHTIRVEKKVEIVLLPLLFQIQQMATGKSHLDKWWFFIVDFRELFRFFYSPGVDQEHLGEHSPSSRKVQKGLYLKTSS